MAIIWTQPIKAEELDIKAPRDGYIFWSRYCNGLIGQQESLLLHSWFGGRGGDETHSLANIQYFYVEI
jgi:hypothetical protein